MSNGVSVFIVFGIVWGRRARDRAVWLCWWKNPFNAINMDNDNNERWKENCAAAISHRIGHFEMEMVYCRLGVGRVAIMKKSLIMIYSTEFVPQSFFRAIRFCSWTAPAATIKSNGQSSKEQIFIVFASVFFFLPFNEGHQSVCLCERSTFMQKMNTSTAWYSTVSELSKWQSIDWPNSEYWPTQVPINLFVPHWIPGKK